jgi:hypothetical protein
VLLHFALTFDTKEHCAVALILGGSHK